MPFIDVATNTSTGPKKREKLLVDIVALGEKFLGKSKDVTMARLSPDETIVFKGTSEPAAYVNVRAIGLPEPETRAAFVAALGALFDDVLDVPAARVFVVFDDVPADRWGASGRLVG